MLSPRGLPDRFHVRGPDAMAPIAERVGLGRELLAADAEAVRAFSRAVALRAMGTERARLGVVEMVADGSIRGFTARMRWPGYYNGAKNGLWYTAPETARELLALALANGVQVHAHTNGDEATDMVLDAMRIGVAAALRAITLGAAFTLKLDGEIGSIEAGKRADFAVLEADPFEADPAKLAEVDIWGVVSDGRPVRAGAA